MPKEDYAAVTGGGLKLKGAANAGISKKRKKSKHQAVAAPENDVTAADENDGGPEATATRGNEGDSDDRAAGYEKGAVAPKAPIVTAGKTEAQIRHEEMRRRRLDERIRREGVKTHKERVEELNKYLSTLSEHHDMYGLFHAVWRELLLTT